MTPLALMKRFLSFSVEKVISCEMPSAAVCSWKNYIDKCLIVRVQMAAGFMTELAVLSWSYQALNKR